MEIKDSILLPKTEFSMKADLPKKEPAILDSWQKNNVYDSLRKDSKDKEKFILHDGPPYANGHLHMASTNYLDIAITNDSGTGQMLSTNMCPLLKICGPTSAVKFLNDQFTNVNFIASQSFGGDDINLITSDAVINEIDKILDS